MITCSREWGVTENTQELNHEESYLLVNCFIEFSLVACVIVLMSSSDGSDGDDCIQDMETIS
jgi:hypothetical protein